MNKDNRQHPRKRMVAEVGYKDEKKHTFGGCIAKDVSVGGVCLQIKEFVPVGTMLDLQFKLPLTSTAFYVKGTVRWIRKMPYNELYEAGLQIPMDKNYAKLVEKYIK